MDSAAAADWLSAGHRGGTGSTCLFPGKWTPHETPTQSAGGRQQGHAHSESGSVFDLSFIFYLWILMFETAEITPAQVFTVIQECREEVLYQVLYQVHFWGTLLVIEYFSFENVYASILIIIISFESFFSGQNVKTFPASRTSGISSLFYIFIYLFCIYLSFINI